MDTIGVGIVGYGLAGEWFHKLLIDEVDGLQITAVMSRSADKLARARKQNPGALITPDFDALLAADAVDLVVLATPHDVHAAQAVAALDAGKAVVTDKIMCRSVAEADAMIASAERSGKLLSVFHNRRWDSDFLTVLAALEGGWLGEVWTVDIAVTRPGLPLRPLTGERRWRSTREGFGGQIVDWGAHLMDQAVLLGGADPDRVFCDLQYRQDGCEVDTEGYVVLHYADGRRITVTAGVQTLVEKPHWWINGSAGTLVVDGIDPQESVMRATRKVPSGGPAACLPREAVRLESLKPADGFGPVAGRWGDYYQNVRDAMLGKSELAVTAEQCRDALRVYEQCFRAAGVRNELTSSRGAGLLGHSSGKGMPWATH
ncbi:MAG: Gfo/Idh/MocA family oxidoreductase [Armatimonadetes bacterium]|nr:Gfo/Idh/MocA family oxidoreductase [Armatimonadota bacterium]